MLSDDYLHLGAALYVTRLPLKALDIRVTNKSFTNLTNVKFTPEQTRLLGLGLKFVPGTRPHDRESISQAYDGFVRHVRLRHRFADTDKQRDDGPRAPWRHGVRHANPTYNPVMRDGKLEHALSVEAKRKFTSRLLELENEFSHISKRSHSKSIYATLRSLAKHEEVIFKPADKNLGLVCVSKDWYRSECLKLLNDQTQYKPLTSDDLDTLYEQCQKWFFALLKKNECHIEEVDDRDVTIHPPPWMKPKFYSSVPLNDIYKLAIKRRTYYIVPYFYGMIKLHKDPIRLRPITAAHSWVTTILGKFVMKELSYFLENDPVIIKSTPEFVKALDKYNENPVPDTVMVSVDVVSLYPSIPRKCMRRWLESAMKRNFRRNHDCEADIKYIGFLLDMVEYMHHCHVVQFDDKYFQQVEGTAMGLNVAPAIANLFMSNFWHIAQAKLKGRLKILLHLLKNYLDDAFFLIERQHLNSLNEVKQLLNSILDEVQLTFVVNEISMDYLDLTLYKVGNIIETKLFAKALNKFLYIPFTSQHARFQLSAWIKAEVLRMVINCSTEHHFDMAFCAFNYHLMDRAYPLWFLRSVYIEIPDYSFEFRQERLNLVKSELDEEERSPTVPLLIPTDPVIARYPHAVGQLLTLTLESEEPLNQLFRTSNSNSNDVAINSLDIVPRITLKKPASIGSVLVRAKFSM